MIIENKNNSVIREFVATKDDIVMPVASTKYSAGYDIKTNMEITLAPGEEIIYNTHLIYKTTETDEFVAIYPRSGLGFKYYCRLANTVGIIDTDYDGEIKIKIRNEGNETMIIPAYTGIAQAIIQPYLRLSPDCGRYNERGTGGFGSTDNK